MEQIFTLPGGYVGADGVIQKEVVLTPVTGRVRKEMGKAESRRRGHSLMNAILSKCIKRIGSIDKIHDGVLDKMSSGDRSFCLMMIRKFRNDAILAEEKCSCGVTNLYEILIDDYEINSIENGDCRIEDVREKPYMVFDIIDSDLGIEATFRFSNGEDERQTEKLMSKNPMEGEFELWRRCLIRWSANGEEAEKPWRKDIFDDLFENQIEYLETQMGRKQPGPSAFQYDICPDCGDDVLITLGKSDFLLPLPEVMKKKYSLRS